MEIHAYRILRASNWCDFVDAIVRIEGNSPDLLTTRVNEKFFNA